MSSGHAAATPLYLTGVDQSHLATAEPAAQMHHTNKAATPVTYMR